MREDIIGRLRLRRPALVFAGFDRPNLFYEVYPVSDDSEKRRVLHRLLAEPDPAYAGAIGAELRRAVAGSGLVYTARTATARSLSRSLNRAGVRTAYYHGQLKPSQRNAVHERFREERCARWWRRMHSAWALTAPTCALSFTSTARPPQSRTIKNPGGQGGTARSPVRP
ncbi:MAG: hypothetical protein U0531_10675 [Dehalococcoidia bacterium]